VALTPGALPVMNYQALGQPPTSVEMPDLFVEDALVLSPASCLFASALSFYLLHPL